MNQGCKAAWCVARIKSLPKANGVPDGWSENFPRKHRASMVTGHQMPGTRNLNARRAYDVHCTGSRLRQIEVVGTQHAFTRDRGAVENQLWHVDTWNSHWHDSTWSLHEKRSTKNGERGPYPGVNKRHGCTTCGCSFASACITMHFNS